MEANFNALISAINLDDQDCVTELLTTGMDPNFCPDDKLTVLMEAAIRGQESTMDALLEVGASVDQQDMKGWTALMHAAQADQLPSVRKLVEAGADVNMTDTALRTPLMASACVLGTKVLKYLVQVGAAVDHQDFHGCTAVMMATKKNSEGAVTALCESGADVNTRDHRRKSPLFYALHGVGNIMEELLKFGGAVTPMEMAEAIKFDKRNAVYRFIKNGFTPDMVADTEMLSDQAQCLNNASCNNHYEDSSPTQMCDFIKIATPFYLSVVYRKSAIARYFLVHHFLTSQDIALLQWLPYHSLFEQAPMVDLLGSMAKRPWTLTTLCLRTVSTCIGFAPGREKRLVQTNLPHLFIEKLLFCRIKWTDSRKWDNLELPLSREA